MKKFLNLICSVCERQIDQPVNNSHYTADKCTITYGCTGRLFPVEYRSNREIQSAPHVGIEDWRPRGSKITEQIQLVDDVLIGLTTGAKNKLVLAVEYSADILNAPQLEIEFTSRSSEHRSFKQFSYTFEQSFNTISGVENGLEKKVLRYSVGDGVEVFINGIEAERGNGPGQFLIYDGTPTSPVPPNIIKFNDDVSLSGSIQVKVIVNKPVSTSSYSLVFKRNTDNEVRINLGAWENVNFVEFFKSTGTTGTGYKSYFLFTCDVDSTSLPLNNVFVVSRLLTADAREIPLGRGAFLLARAPYSILDRYLNLYIPLDGLSIDRDYLKFSLIDKTATLQATKTAIATCYPPFRILPDAKFSVEKTLKRQISGVSNQITIDGSIIVGPDA